MLDNKLSVILLVLSLASLLYSGVVLSVRSGTFSFVIWIALACVFAAFSYLAYGDHWNAMMPIVRHIICIFTGIAVIVFVICQAAILSHFFDKGEKELNYIVVLGAQMRKNGPSIVYKYRLDKAYDYLIENEDTVCILTGGRGSNENISESEGGREYLIGKGIEPERLLVETKSHDTVENIKYAYEIINDNKDTIKIGIVTNSFHVFRGVSIAKKCTSAEIYGIAAYMQPLYLPNNMVRESFGIIRDFVNRNI